MQHLTEEEKMVNNFQVSKEANLYPLIQKPQTKDFSYSYPRLSPPGISLTKRQSECFYLLSKFPTVKKIARILNLSPRTIEMYIGQIKSKMGVSCKSDLVEKAIALVTEKPL